MDTRRAELAELATVLPKLADIVPSEPALAKSERVGEVGSSCRILFIGPTLFGYALAGTINAHNEVRKSCGVCSKTAEISETRFGVSNAICPKCRRHCTNHFDVLILIDGGDQSLATLADLGVSGDFDNVLVLYLGKENDSTIKLPAGFGQGNGHHLSVDTTPMQLLQALDTLAKKRTQDMKASPKCLLTESSQAFLLPGAGRKRGSVRDDEQVPAPFRDNRKSFSLSPLTARERELAQLAAKGLSNEEIAQKLFLSLPTVKSHLQKIFRKLGIKRRGQISWRLL